MGAVKICVHPRAKNPYYVETTGIRLYSMEELAYYLYENIYLIDHHILGERLYTWIEKEIRLPKLAERLRSGNDTGNHVYNQVMNILYAAEYHSKEQLAELSEKITAISGMQTQERMKYKADELLQNDNYWAAITEYEKILSIRQNSKLDVEFYAKVWNNLGVSYGRLFLFRKAASCFENAYQFKKIPEYKKKVYYAKKMEIYGRKDAEPMGNVDILPEFQKQAEKMFHELEAQTDQFCETADAEQLFLSIEKRYLRNSCI